ncbi:MAG: RNA-binding S4 domain-containing protein [Planctomycetota bacterium]
MSDEPVYIRLDNFLKAAELVQSGGEAKYRIQSGEVCVNGELETRRSRKLFHGDVVALNEEEYTVEFE